MEERRYMHNVDNNEDECRDNENSSGISDADDASDNKDNDVIPGGPQYFNNPSIMQNTLADYFLSNADAIPWQRASAHVL